MIIMMMTIVGIPTLANLLWIDKGVKSFIDGTDDYFDNSRDAKRVSSAILLLVNCNLCSNKLSVSLPLGI